MNYWPRWIRAIRGKTLALSMAQMGAYDRLLDYYYEEERPLPSDIDECCRIAGAASKQDRVDVQKVLGKFFTLRDDGYSQERADAELLIGLKKIDAAKSNGKAGGRPKGSKQKPTGLPTGLDAANPAETQGEPRAKAPHPHHQKEITVEDYPTLTAGQVRPAGFTPTPAGAMCWALRHSQLALDSCTAMIVQPPADAPAAW